MRNLSDDPQTDSDSMDAVIDAYKKDVDRTLLRQNLKLTPEERLRSFDHFAAFAQEVRRAGKEAKSRKNGP